MANELVKALRRQAKIEILGLDTKGLLKEAANEIERLQTKLDNIVRDFGHIEAVKERAKR
jgi:hypothetical protein